MEISPHFNADTSPWDRVGHQCEPQGPYTGTKNSPRHKGERR